MTAHNQSGFSIILVCLIVVLIIASLGTGYFFIGSKFSSPKRESNERILSNAPAPTENTSKLENGNKVSTVSEALTASIGKSIKCTRINESSDTPPGTAYIKDGKIRFDGGNKGLMLEPKTSGLSTNEALWIWVPNTTEGQKLAVSPIDPSSPKDVAKGLDEYKQNCSFVEVDDEYFIAPENINFKNY